MTTFIANIGALLGLTMGLSLVSVVEIVFFCLKFTPTMPSIMRR